MKIIYLFFIVFGLLFMIGGCSKKVNTMVLSEHEIRIDLEQVLDTILFSNLFEKISYIKIPTNDTFLIGRIDKLVVDDNHIFILDKTLSRAVFCIDTNGNKIFEINRVGRGPGEYVDLKDIAYDSIHKELLLFCYVRQMIIWFDLQGNYLREKKIPFRTVSIQPLKDRGFVLFCDYNLEDKLKNGDYHPNIIVIDSNLKVIGQDAYFRGFIDSGVVWTSMPDFFSFGDVVGIKPDHNNIVYHIKNRSITAAWKLDLGKHSIDDRYWEKAFEKGMTAEKLEDFCKNMRLFECVYYCEDDNIIYFMCRCCDVLYYVFYSKETKQIIQTSQFANDLDFFVEFIPKTLKDNKFYGIVNASTICSLRERLKSVNALPNKVLETIEIFDNPVLVIYTMKKF